MATMTVALDRNLFLACYIRVMFYKLVELTLGSNMVFHA